MFAFLNAFRGKTSEEESAEPSQVRPIQYLADLATQYIIHSIHIRIYDHTYIASHTLVTCMWLWLLGGRSVWGCNGRRRRFFYGRNICSRKEEEEEAQQSQEDQHCHGHVVQSKYACISHRLLAFPLYFLLIRMTIPMECLCICICNPWLCSCSRGCIGAGGE